MMGRKDLNYGKYMPATIVESADYECIHFQRHNYGYGWVYLMCIADSPERIKAFWERHQRTYPINGYGGRYGEPEDLGNGLWIGYASHSESCD